MYRLMTALFLLFLLSEIAKGEFPFDSISNRAFAKPLTDFGRYHGVGYGPGYHSHYPTVAAQAGLSRGVRRDVLRAPSRSTFWSLSPIHPRGIPSHQP
jgi:hypothetical protein